MKQLTGRVCWLVYGLAVVLCVTQIGIDSGSLSGSFFASTLGIATIGIFIGGAALCAIWDS